MVRCSPSCSHLMSNTLANAACQGENTSTMAISSRQRTPTSRLSSIKSSDSLSRRGFRPALGCWTSGAASAGPPDISPESEVARWRPSPTVGVSLRLQASWRRWRWRGWGPHHHRHHHWRRAAPTSCSTRPQPPLRATAPCGSLISTWSRCVST